MKLPIFQVDAFTDTVFGGNPAAVVPLDSWLSDATLKAIANENNLSETAFLVREEGGYAIRWFTPAIEVPLCGHATLASAHVVVEHLEPGASEVRLRTREHGDVNVVRDRQFLAIEFPRFPPVAREPDERVVGCLRSDPEELLFAHDNWFAVYEREADVLALKPDFGLMKECVAHGVIATAPGSWPKAANGSDGYHFCSRYFVPAAGIDEDPVTGSAHCALTPYWAERLGEPHLSARQVSARGGKLLCVDDPDRDRIRIAGQSRLYMKGTIEVPG